MGLLCPRVVEPAGVLIPQPEMKLSDVLSAAMALTADERLRLVDAIAIIDDWQIDIVDKPQAEEKVSQDLLRGVVGVWPQPKSRNRQAYSVDDLALLQEIAAIEPGSMEERPQMRRAAKKLGRTYKAIAEKIRTIRAK